MDIAPFSNKRVAFRYSGLDLAFDLSQGLFSSFDIDAGSKLLLKTLALRGRMGEAATALDCGCGVGTICVSLAAANPALRVEALDRDALALSFTEANAGLNGVGQRVKTRGALLLDIDPGERFDRIVSNLPAKAGQEALADFFSRAPSFLSPGGIVGIVIVHTLGDFARRAIRAAGHEILHEEKARDYAVFLFAQAAPAATDSPAADPLSPYSRGLAAFSLRGAEYALLTVHGLPDFDQIGNDIELSARFMDSGRARALSERLGGRLLVWGPGQGHLPAWLAVKCGSRDISLAGRDLLSLKAARASLSRLAPGTAVPLLHLADPSILESGPYEAIIAFPESLPGYDWCARACAAFRANIGPEGMILLVGRSGELSSLDKRRPLGLGLRGDRREKGKRAIIYERADEGRAPPAALNTA